MQTWCIYIDEAGSPYDNDQFQVIYAAICVPFNSQQKFLKSYLTIVDSLMDPSGGEIKYGPLLNHTDEEYREETERVCSELLECFFEIEGARIIQVKAIKRKMRKEDDELRAALFGKTLELCKESLPSDHSAMILHDELPPGNQQNALLQRFNRFNETSPTGLNFQNCVFAHSNENPLIQFADFVASICYRYYYFGKHEYKKKKKSRSLVNSLFRKIEAHPHSPPIVELSEPKGVKDTSRSKQASRLASKHNIDLSTAYNIVDKNITLEEVLRRKQTRAFSRSRGKRRKLD